VVSKVLERIHAESAGRLLGEDWQLVEIAEPPDFEVRTPRATFGLEVRQVFADQELASGSPAKREESLNARAVRSLADGYYSGGGKPVSARFLGPVHGSNRDCVVATMLARQPTYPNGRDVFNVGELKIYLTALPPAVGHYRRWLCVNDRVGWLRDATSIELQCAVDRKASNLQLYLQKFEEVVLLLVADTTFNSGLLQAHEDLSVKSPGYSAIYFLSHPERIVRVA
jgi:hypothetical protein